MRNTISSVAIGLLLTLSANGCGSGSVTGQNGRDPLVRGAIDGVTVDGEKISGTGTVNFFHLEGGFWAIRGDDNRVYDPVNLSEEFQRENLRVRFSGTLLRDMASIHMVGDIVRLTSIQRR